MAHVRRRNYGVRKGKTGREAAKKGTRRRGERRREKKEMMTESYSNKGLAIRRWMYTGKVMLRRGVIGRQKGEAAATWDTKTWTYAYPCSSNSCVVAALPAKAAAR